jgi:hypothetical protein
MALFTKDRPPVSLWRDGVIHFSGWLKPFSKCFDSNGDAKYRTCLAGSPTTHLMETWLLSRLSQDDEFRLHPSVYSYHWSEPNSGYIYRYFVR